MIDFWKITSGTITKKYKKEEETYVEKEQITKGFIILFNNKLSVTFGLCSNFKRLFNCFSIENNATVGSFFRAFIFLVGAAFTKSGAFNNLKEEGNVTWNIK